MTQGCFLLCGRGRACPARNFAAATPFAVNLQGGVLTPSAAARGLAALLHSRKRVKPLRPRFTRPPPHCVRRLSRGRSPRKKGSPRSGGTPRCVGRCRGATEGSGSEGLAELARPEGLCNLAFISSSPPNTPPRSPVPQTAPLPRCARLLSRGPCLKSQ